MQSRAKWSFSAISNAQIFIAFTIIAYAIYSPSLDGQFVSDDIHYVQANGYIHDLTLDHVVAILDPTGPLPRVVENYAPVHLLLHGAAWQVFGDAVRGHHTLNVVMHALAACLLVALFRRCGLSALAATLGGTFFLLHPANVEAVAWINQLKTTSAMALCLGALLCHPRRPAFAAILFALSLLAKPTGAVALFAVIAFGLSRPKPTTPSRAQDGDSEPDWRWGWIAVWVLVFAVFAVFEFTAFSQTAGQHRVHHPELGLRMRTTLAVALRYLVMATSSYGLSVFQEPDPASSLLDPWWLASLGVLSGLAWRSFVVLKARKVEGAWWVWVVVSFAPISGLIPLPHIIADRYLYFMLPGLIAGTLLAGRELMERRLTSSNPAAAASLVRVLTTLALIVIVAFAARSHGRAFVWRSSETMTADVIRHYPEGRWASLELAGRAAEAGDVERAVTYVLAARARGFDRLDYIMRPRYASIQRHPQMIALMRELAREWIARVDPIVDPTQSDLMVRGQAHIVLGEFDAARADIRSAIYAGGPMTDYLYTALEQLDQLERAHATTQ